jgi:hypothetical protein
MKRQSLGDLPSTHRVVLAVEPLLTVARNLAAQEQGYKAGDF